MLRTAFVSILFFSAVLFPFEVFSAGLYGQHLQNGTDTSSNRFLIEWIPNQDYVVYSIGIGTGRSSSYCTEDVYHNNTVVIGVESTVNAAWDCITNGNGSTYYSIASTTPYTFLEGETYYFSAGYRTNSNMTRYGYTSDIKANLRYVTASLGASPFFPPTSISTAGGLPEPVFAVCDTYGDCDPYDEVITNTTTRFTGFTPTLGVETPNATSTAFVVGASGYVNTNDYDDDVFLEIRYRQASSVGQPGNSIFAQGEEIHIPITAEGTFDLSTTTPITNFGVYFAGYMIKDPAFTVFGIPLFENTLVSASGNFIVGTTTGGYVPTDAEVQLSEIVLESSGSAFTDVQIITENNATSTVLSLARFLDVREIMFSKFPLNWAAKTVDVLLTATTSATSTLPGVEFDFADYETLGWFTDENPGEDLNIEFFGWAWIYDLSDLAGVQALRAMAVVALYISLVFLAWKETQRIWNQITN